MRKTKKLTLSAILCALSVIFLYIGSLFELLDLSFVVLTSLIVVFIQIEINSPYQYFVYASSSILSLLMLPGKYVALLYIFFGGLYPLIRVYVNKLPCTLSWVVKVLFFNLLFTATLLASKYIFGLPEESETMKWALYAMGNLTFVLYDLLLARLIAIYAFKLRPRFLRFLK